MRTRSRNISPTATPPRGLRVVVDVRMKSGEVVPLEISVTSLVIGGQRRFLLSPRDLSARRANDELAESSRRLELAVDGAKLGTWTFDIETGRTWYSDRSKAMYGLPPDAEMSTAVIRAAVHPDHWEEVSEPYLNGFTAGPGRGRISGLLPRRLDPLDLFARRPQPRFRRGRPKRQRNPSRHHRPQAGRGGARRGPADARPRGRGRRARPVVGRSGHRRRLAFGNVAPAVGDGPRHADRCRDPEGLYPSRTIGSWCASPIARAFPRTSSRSSIG